MLAFLADENFHGRIVRGLRRQQPALDIIRVQDIEKLQSADDPTLLEWAAQAGRILLTHDAATIIGYAYDRVRLGLPMPGVFEISHPRRPISSLLNRGCPMVAFSFVAVPAGLRAAVECQGWPFGASPRSRKPASSVSTQAASSAESGGGGGGWW
jgi:hypothetical protein